MIPKTSAIMLNGCGIIPFNTKPIAIIATEYTTYLESEIFIFASFATSHATQLKPLLEVKYLE